MSGFSELALGRGGARSTQDYAPGPCDPRAQAVPICPDAVWMPHTQPRRQAETPLPNTTPGTRGPRVSAGCWRMESYIAARWLHHCGAQWEADPWGSVSGAWDGPQGEGLGRRRETR